VQAVEELNMAKLTPAQRVEGFKALVASDKSGSYYMEDVNGSHRLWKDMTRQGKLDHIVGNAAYYDVPFEAFAQVARETLGDLPPGALEQAALRVAFASAKELRAVAKALPDWWEKEHQPPPLAEQVQELVDAYLKDTGHCEMAKGRDLEMDKG
jgi:hypothetical protein